MAAVNLAKAWGNGEGIAHMTLSEAKQQFDEETLRLLDPAAYHELKAQEREEVIRGYIADDQQKLVSNRTEIEERSREVLRDMLTTSNQIAYHNFADRVDATDKELGDMLQRQRQKLFEAQRELHRLRDNGLHQPDGSIIYPKADGTGATDSHGKPVAIDPEELKRQMAAHPDATTSEAVLACAKRVDFRAEQVRRNEEYRTNLEQMKAELAKHKDDPDYQQRVEAFNKKWAGMLDNFPDRARERLLRHDSEAAAVYSQYGDKSKAHVVQTDPNSDDLPAMSAEVIVKPDIATATATAASPVISQFQAAADPTTAEALKAGMAKIQGVQADIAAPDNTKSVLSSEYNAQAKGDQVPAAATIDYFALDAVALPQNKGISSSYNAASSNALPKSPIVVPAADLPASDTTLPATQKVAAANTAQAAL